MNKILLVLALFVSNTWASTDTTTITVGYGPGGTDTIIRMLAGDAEAYTDFKFTVENKAGANGVIALKYYFALPAGNKNALGISGGQVLFEAIANPENNFIQRLKFVGPVLSSPLAIGVSNKSQFKTLDKLFNKNIPRQRINIGVAGESHNMLVEQLKKYSHHDIQAIRFKGSTESYTALLGGHIDMQSDAYGFFKQKEGAVRILGVADADSIDGVPSLHKYAPTANLVNFFAVAVNRDAPDNRNLADALTVGFVKANRYEYFKNLGYNVDMNRKSDYVDRVVVPTYKKWATK
jgi:tripartite-type tricarboxylate transporter receptor subunit TctC